MKTGGRAFPCFLKKGGRAIPCNLEKGREGNDCKASLPPRAVAALLAPLVHAPTPCRCGARCCHTAVRLRSCGGLLISQGIAFPAFFFKTLQGIDRSTRHLPCAQVLDPDFMVWVRPSGLSKMRKLYRCARAHAHAHTRTLMRTRAHCFIHGAHYGFPSRLVDSFEC